MIRVSIGDGDYNDLMQVLKGAGKNTKSGLKKVINQTARDAKKEIHTKVLGDYVVKKKYFGNEQIKMVSATESRLIASISTAGRPIHLREFRSRKNSKKEAAKAFVKNGNQYKALETQGLKAFTAKMSNGKIAILRRSGKDQYPIKALHGPGRAQMARTVYEKNESDIQNSLKNNINRMIEQIIGGRS